MATITYNNGASVLPAIGDVQDLLSHAANPFVIVSSNATTIVLENAFARVTLTADAASQFQYTNTTFPEAPTSGSVSSVDVDVFTSPSGLSDFFTASYTTPLSIIQLIYTYGAGYWQFIGENIASQADTITGSAAADWIHGRLGNDSIDGGSGTSADTIDGGTGVDTMAGGGGNDYYIVDNNADIVTEAASGGIDTVGMMSFYTTTPYTLGAEVENVEVAPAWVVGTSYIYYGGNVLGNGLANVMRGAQANDTLGGGDGNDRIVGNGGNDLIDGGTGNDTMLGGDGDDTFTVDAAGDRVVEMTSYNLNDKVISTVNHTLSANVEHLELGGTDNINGTGNAGNNTITANAGNNVLNGGAGIDTLSYQKATTKVTVALNTGAAQATGGSGSDTVSNFEHLIGGSAGDDLTGNSDANMLDGDGVLYRNGTSYAPADDTMTGLGGDDTYFVNTAGDRVVEAAGGGTDTVMSTISYTLGSNQENLTLTTQGTTGTGNTAANLIVGSAYTHNLQGLGGADTLVGGNNYVSNDTLDGGGGADSMAGSLGSDLYFVDNAGDVISEVVYYTSDVNTVSSSINYTLGANLHNLILTDSAIRGAGNLLNNVITANGNDNVLNGGRGIDTVSYAGTAGAITLNLGTLGAQATGGSGSDLIRNFENVIGGEGNDTLTGSSRDNRIDGGAGADSMVGGAGDDVFVVDNAGDVAVDSGRGTDRVEASVNHTLGAAIENLTLTGSALNGTGNTLANLLTGNGSNNQLSGLGGADTLAGGFGNDTLDGGGGNDTFILNDNTDVLLDSAGTDTAVLDYGAYNVTLGATIENAVVVATNYYGNVTVTGNDLANRITGQDLTNNFNGGAGNDTLAGGGGNDTLTGGAGSDAFLFDAPLTAVNYYTGIETPNNIDNITDFSVTDDVILLDDDIFTALPATATGQLGAPLFYSGTAAHDADDRIIYNSATGALYYDPDGNGAQAQVQFATIATGLALSNTSFDIV